jgi:tetratricopeptide (TPR) repeat protein
VVKKTRPTGENRPVSGRSLVPALTGNGPLAPASIYSESLSPRYHFGWSELYALSDDRYRLIRAPKDELYDLSQDPKELTSIADQRVPVRTAMRRALDGLIAANKLTAPAVVSPEDRQRLAALGYVGTQTGTSLETDSDKLPDPKDRVGILKKYKRATDLAGMRQFSDAITLYREILRDEPGMSDVWLQLADIYNRIGMTAQAVDAFKEVVKRHQKDPAGLTGAAAGLLRLGRLDEAKAHAELAIDVAPATSHELLARIALQRGQAELARREAVLAQQADATLPLAEFVEGALLHAQGQYAAAIPHLERARDALQKRTVQVPDVNYYLGDSLGRLERYPDALRAFQAELALFPGHVRARAGMAMVYRVQGQRKQSEQAIADLLQNVPTREAYDVATQLWTMFGEPGRAAQTRAAAARLPR